MMDEGADLFHYGGVVGDTVGLERVGEVEPEDIKPHPLVPSPFGEEADGCTRKSLKELNCCLCFVFLNFIRYDQANADLTRLATAKQEY